MEFEYDLVVIGAGWAGLASAKTYHQLHPGRRVVVLDRDSTIGGVWSEARLYPGLKTNNLVGTYEYPDFPMVPGQYGLERGQHIPGRVVHEYLARYAERFGVADKIRYNCTVESAEHLAGGGWRLLVAAERTTRGVVEEEGEGEDTVELELRTRRLVVATGLTSEPALPAFEGAGEFGAPLFHSRDFSKHAAATLAEAKSVTVVGGAKSAWDAVYAYASRGVHVDWVIREGGNGPVWQTPPYVTPLRRWLEQLALTRALTWLSPCIWGDADGYARARRLWHGTRAGRALARLFWWALGRDVLAANAYGAHPETARLRPRTDPFFTATSFAILNYDADFFALVRRGGVRVRVAGVARLAPRAVLLADGTRLAADALVCATGWRHAPPLRFLPEGVERDLGLPHALRPGDGDGDGDGDGEPFWRRDLVDRADAEILGRFPRLRDQPAAAPADPDAVAPYHLFRFLVPPSPALLATRDVAFAGYMMNFVHAVVSHVQAVWIAAYFDGDLSPSVVPPPSDAGALEALCYQTVLHNRFGRWRYPAGHGHQFPDFIFDALPYIDLLLSDLRLVAHRKSGWWAEATEPYGPADYKDLVAEWGARKT